MIERAASDIMRLWLFSFGRANFKRYLSGRVCVWIVFVMCTFCVELHRIPLRKWAPPPHALCRALDVTQILQCVTLHITFSSKVIHYFYVTLFQPKVRYNYNYFTHYFFPDSSIFWLSIVWNHVKLGFSFCLNHSNKAFFEPNFEN